MPQLTTVLVGDTEQEIKPQLKTLLQNRLKKLATLYQQFETLSDEIAVVEGDIEDARQLAGYLKMDFPGYGGVTRVEGQTTKKLDKTKLIAGGVTLAQIEAATTEKPKKGHTLFRPAGIEPKKTRGDEE